MTENGQRTSAGGGKKPPTLWIVLIVIVYWLSPIDFAPGMLDDLIVTAVGYWTNRQMSR